jgi:hypothetical protein
MTEPAPGATETQVVRWHSVAFLNLWGDDGGRGTRTFADRLPQMVADLTKNRPEVIGVCELRASNEPHATDLFAAQGYVRMAHSHRLGIYAVPTAVNASTGFYRYPTQNEGAAEGILRQRLKIDGSWVHYGVTHLDYREGFAEGRVDQMKDGIRAMESFARRWRLPRWTTRSVIAGDLNSTHWVVQRALEPAGFKDVGAGAAIDVIAVGRGRKILSASHRRTASDHPIVEATLGKIVPVEPLDV